ncbi:MAG: response regulator, partial [Myxococcota bacterium]
MTGTDSPESKATVLIVDDTPTNLRILLENLNRNNYRVLVAEDGESALARAVYAQPDIILLDVMMPGMDGFETCERLKQDEQTRDIPVIFMTALSSVEDKVKSFRAGAVDYISKPFRQEEILARLDTHLRLRFLQKELQEQNAVLAEEIAQRKASELELQRNVAELRARNNELDTFARAVAHDLRNELAFLIGTAELLADEVELPPESAADLDNIIMTGRRMSDTFQALLLLGQLRHGAATMRPLNMTDLLSRVRVRLATAIAEKQAEIAEPETWQVTRGYAPWIEEVWLNYISNAIKYGGSPPHIEVGCTEVAAMSPAPSSDTPPEGVGQPAVRYWVRDNGSGVSEELKPLLFGDMIDLEKISNEGYGLGLSIVKQIIEKLG